MRSVAFIVAFIVSAGSSAAEGVEGSACKRGDTPFADLNLSATFSENLRHQSLEGAPDVPEAGVVVPLTCTVAKDGSLKSCTASCADTAAAPFVPAALKRVQPIRARETLRSGGSSVGTTTTVELRFVQTDRFAAAPINFARGDTLIFTADPKGGVWTKFYPIRAIEVESEAVIDIACVVQADLSADCPHIAVRATNDDDGALVPHFENAARQIAKIFRVAPKTSDGKSSPGIWFRKRIRFMLQ